jgi:hypothetical protein
VAAGCSSVFGINLSLDAELTEDVEQKKGDDAERNKPDKHHNYLLGNFARQTG